MSRQKEVRKFVNWLALRKIKIYFILLIAAKTSSNNKLSTYMIKQFFQRSVHKAIRNLFENKLYKPSYTFELLLQKQILKKECKAIFFSSLAGSISLRGKWHITKLGEI